MGEPISNRQACQVEFGLSGLDCFGGNRPLLLKAAVAALRSTQLLADLQNEVPCTSLQTSIHL